MAWAVIALGSNLGDRLAHLRGAWESLDALGERLATSSLYESAPVGGPEQNPYLNAVVVLDTDLDPVSLLDGLTEVEEAAGRVREERWGPRTLDLDIILIEGVTVQSPRLQVPHPRAIERRFVLDPLAEVLPQATIDGSPVSALASAVASQEVQRLWLGWERPDPGFAAKGGWWVVGQGVLLLAWFWAFLIGVRSPAGWRWLGLLPLLAGGAMLVWAVPALGRSLTPFPEPLPGGDLAIAGPYGLVRHPMYGGIVLALAGVTVLAGPWLALAIVAALLALFGGKAVWEERRLRAAYPGYGSYAARVGKRLIPGVI
jgi:2-amino-4-hydroxy-6-hydroxymethyldihydropteridine diphosphokinase